MDRIHMTKVIGGKKYSTKTATLIADDVYWDGHNFERSGRNSWLYRTTKGAFFTVSGTFWQGEQDTLEPVSVEAAKELFEGPLSEHYMEWEAAFQEEAQEPEPERGRPPKYGEKMKQIGVWMPEEMITWLQGQPDGISETVRALIEKAMEAERKGDVQNG